ncbi:MAG TPA: SAM-dependent methyltransferase [Verrucomicrobiales bacterium]|nr:SAM-dependent methyltransferase [Verrucomicrobiales bacterium]
MRDSFIVCRNSQGAQIRAVPLRMTRHVVVFEVYNPYSIVQLSEVLSEFQIFVGEKLMYSGRAVVSNLLNTGIMLVCEASLDEAWLDVDVFAPVHQRDRLRAEFTEFIREWAKIHDVAPAFKVVVADLQTFLVDLRRWMEQVELGVRSMPSGSRMEVEREIIGELKDPVFPELVPLFVRFEQTSSLISEELRPAHCAYAKRQLHPIVSCAPFFFRSWQKPLGYAGDYEMVNMMVRDPMEGGTMFAKLLNQFFLSTPPVVAHRNRIVHMARRLSEEARRCARNGERLRVFNLGCGPAHEIQRFIQEDDISDRVDFTLLDFNDQTLEYTGRILNELKMRNRRTSGISTVLKSVHQILKEAGRPTGELRSGGYQMVYCAGLFDYLSDRICKRLMTVFYDLVAPGGLLLATNVEANNPSRNWMEYVTEWHLVYRDPPAFISLAPDDAPKENCTVTADPSGVNIFLEIRKPAAVSA